MTTTPGVDVTLSASLYRHLKAEARALGVSMEWLIASMIVDTVEPTEQIVAAVPVAA